jgi:hypothetical protein
MSTGACHGFGGRPQIGRGGSLQAEEITAHRYNHCTHEQNSDGVRADAQHLFRDAPLGQPFPQRAEAALHGRFFLYGGLWLGVL